MTEFKNNIVINPTPKRKPSKASFVLKDLALKYYDTLEPIVNDLASKCTGGEEATLAFPMGKVIIKLK
jgi:hypothetical protein